MIGFSKAHAVTIHLEEFVIKTLKLINSCHLDIFIPRPVLYSPTSEALAVKARPRDLTLGLVIDISVVLGEGVAPHHVLLVPVVLSSITIHPGRKDLHSHPIMILSTVMDSEKQFTLGIKTNLLHTSIALEWSEWHLKDHTYLM